MCFQRHIIAGSEKANLAVIHHHLNAHCPQGQHEHIDRNAKEVMMKCSNREKAAAQVEPARLIINLNDIRRLVCRLGYHQQ